MTPTTKAEAQSTAAEAQKPESRPRQIFVSQKEERSKGSSDDTTCKDPLLLNREP